MPPPVLFRDHNDGDKLHTWANRRITKSCKITPVQKQRAHDLLKQPQITFSVKIVVEQDKLIFHTHAASPPIFRVERNPSPFICQEKHYKFDRYTKNCRRHSFLQSSFRIILHMSSANLIILLINLLLSYPRPVNQPIKFDNRNILTPKSGVKGLIVTHYDCSLQHTTNMQYHRINKIGECKIKPAEFQILPAKVSIFLQIPTLQVRAHAIHAKFSDKERFCNKISLKRGFRFSHDNWYVNNMERPLIPTAIEAPNNLHALVS